MTFCRDGYKTKIETDSLIPINLKQVDNREKATPTEKKDLASYQKFQRLRHGQFRLEQ